MILQVDADPEDYPLCWGTSPDRLVRLDSARTRYLSSEVAGGFIGTYVGLFATGSGRPAGVPATFDWFDYEARPEPAR